MPILDIQKRARELGRIRIGQTKAITKRDGTPGIRPEKLDRFRLTSASRPLLEKVAELYGGTVTEWEPQGGGAKAWEVVTNSDRLPIMVPPQPVTQWYEYWTAGGCKHRCDGRTNVLTDEFCDEEDSAHREALKRPTTRLNVVLRDVEGIGVWRLETHGWNAAVELPNAAEFLAQAGGYVNGWVSLEQRTSKAEVTKNGETKIETRHFMVPIIEIDVTPAELMAGRGRVSTPVLEGPVAGQPAAIAGPAPDYVALAGDLVEAEQVRNLWRQANTVGHMTQGLSEHLQRRVAEIEASPAAGGSAGATSAAEPDAEGVVEGEVVAEVDPDQVWQQILAAAGVRGMTLPDVDQDCSTFLGGLSSAEASGAELAEYLADLVGRPEAGAA